MKKIKGTKVAVLPRRKVVWAVFERQPGQRWPGQYMDGDFRSLKEVRGMLNDLGARPHSQLHIVRMRLIEER